MERPLSFILREGPSHRIDTHPESNDRAEVSDMARLSNEAFKSLATFNLDLIRHRIKHFIFYVSGGGS